MKILTIHYLEKKPYSTEELRSIKSILDLDMVTQVIACNEIEHRQYPTFEITEL